MDDGLLINTMDGFIFVVKTKEFLVQHCILS
jgi:hypothetical protein